MNHLTFTRTGTGHKVHYHAWPDGTYSPAGYPAQRMTKEQVESFEQSKAVDASNLIAAAPPASMFDLADWD